MLFSVVLAACGGGGGGTTTPTPDTTPPTVSSTSPANNATNVALNSAITATFSEAMTASTLTTTTFTLNNGVTGTVTYSGTTATFTPSSNLATNTTYIATITTGVKDAAGNAMTAAYTESFTTGTTIDNTPPTVSSTNPANAATGIAVNAAITATFSETMTASTVTTATFTIGGVTGTVNYSGTTATFTPSSNLAYSTTYTATITNGVKDAAGNAMAANNTWTFTTGAAPDTTPPTVSSTSPVNNATGVAVNAAITATFSENMDAATISTSTFTLNNGVTGAVTYSGTTATFTPSSSLAYSTAYTATISTAVTDLAGNHLATAKTWSFTTGAVPDTTPPTVSSTNPANAATGVAVNAAITATFSEAVSNVTSATFTVAGVTGTVNYSGTTATFTPSSSLAYSTTYTATISTGVKDLANNALAAAKTWSFTTGAVPDTTPPTVSSTSPANGATGVAVNPAISATFSEAVSNVTSATFTVAGVTGTVNYSGTTATFTPSSNLAYSNTYTATISTAVTDLAGNHLAAAKTWSFTTGALAVYAVSGKVTGPWVDGLTINMTGSATGTTTTDASGNYSFPAQPNGSYTFTPAALAGYTYTPASVTIANAVPVVPNIVASSAIASNSISGTVSYAGLKTGSIAIRVYPANCPGCADFGGTVIAATGSYTIRGLQSGTFDVKAEMDALGTGVRNANNPKGIITNITIPSAGNNISLGDPSAPTPVTPTGLVVQSASGAAFILWDPMKDATGTEIATSYKIYWGTDAAATNGTPIIVTASDTGGYFQGGLTNGTTYYYKVASRVGASESAVSAVVSVVIGAPTGLNTVSGTVSVIPATIIPANAPMIVGLYNNGAIYFTRIASPTNSQSFSIAGVPDGIYSNFAVIDMDNNGTFSIGDITNANGNAPAVTVSGNTTSNVTLSSDGATASVHTNHDGTYHNYSLLFGINDGAKHAVSATIISGANIPVPLDLVTVSGNDTWHDLGINRPAVLDTYKFRVKFSDNSTQDFSGSVTGVLDSFAQFLTVQTTAPGTTNVPLLIWSAPAVPPASYTYHVSIYGNNSNWWYPQDNGLPSTITSVLYNADGRATPASLTSGFTYQWQVLVQDGNRNQANSQSSYTVP